jgi:hypothetical protein
MPTASIQLLLSGPDLSMEEAEQFGQFIGFAVKAAGASMDGRKIDVGQIALLPDKRGDVDGG